MHPTRKFSKERKGELNLKKKKCKKKLNLLPTMKLEPTITGQTNKAN